VLDDILAQTTPVRPMRVYKMPGGTEVAKEFMLIDGSQLPSPDVPYVSEHILPRLEDES
jgi:hypothetical protein